MGIRNLKVLVDETEGLWFVSYWTRQKNYSVAFTSREDLLEFVKKGEDNDVLHVEGIVTPDGRAYLREDSFEDMIVAVQNHGVDDE